jgi:hypothetical protein
LLGGSLATLQQELGGARLALERLGAAFGETGFGPTAQRTTAMAEGAVFLVAIALGLLWIRRR